MAEKLPPVAEQYPDRYTLNADRSVTWTLIQPLKTADGETDTITLRRPKAKEIKAIRGKSDGDKTVWVIAQLSGIAPPYLDELDGEDFTVLGRIFADFLGVSQTTGDA